MSLKKFKVHLTNNYLKFENKINRTNLYLFAERLWGNPSESCDKPDRHSYFGK